MDKDRIIHKLTERPPRDGYVWHILTACQIKVEQYRGSFLWKEVNCKKCLKLKKVSSEQESGK